MRLVILLTAVALIGVALLTFGVTRRRHELTRAFRTLPLGTPKSELIRQLGTPWKVAKCGETFGGGSPQGCLEEVIYSTPFAPWLPQYWGFLFDTEGKLMQKREYISP